MESGSTLTKVSERKIDNLIVYCRGKNRSSIYLDEILSCFVMYCLHKSALQNGRLFFIRLRGSGAKDFHAPHYPVKFEIGLLSAHTRGPRQPEDTAWLAHICVCIGGIVLPQ